MPNEYLIAHKVRGELAFDVAIQVDIGTATDPGPWWVIPTSGHRAYPFWSVPLTAMLVADKHPIQSLIDAVPDLPADIRDHYAVIQPPAKRKLNLDELNLEELGL